MNHHKFNTQPYRATDFYNYSNPKSNFIEPNLNINTMQNSLNHQSPLFPSIDFNQRPLIKFPENIFSQPPPRAFNNRIEPPATNLKPYFFNDQIRNCQYNVLPPTTINSNFNPNNSLIPNTSLQFIQQSNHSIQNQSIPLRNVIDFSRLPPPCTINAPPVPDFLRFPPPNIFNFRPDINQTHSFAVNTKSSFEDCANFPITSSAAGNGQDADMLFVASFSNKIKSRSIIKNSNQICLKDVASQIKELQKLQESLTTLQNCLQYKACNSEGNTINEEEEGNMDNVDECQCGSISTEYNFINFPMNHQLVSQLIKNKIEKIKSVLNEDVIKKATFKYKKILKKKKRLKKKKEISAVRRQEFDKMFEEWQRAIMADEKVIKEKLELHKAVEGTMSEVRMKIADLSKQLKLFTQLKKLRKIRAERRKKNEMSTEEFNIATKKFDMRSDALEKFLNNRMSIYKDEEHTLKVMLDVEAEVDAETLIRRRKKDEQMRTTAYKKQLHEYLFGKKLDLRPEDPMFSFKQHYRMAEDNIHNFLAIRSEWDACIVNEGHENSSSVSLTYIQPSPPSNSQWAEYIKK